MQDETNMGEKQPLEQIRSEQKSILGQELDLNQSILVVVLVLVTVLVMVLFFGLLFLSDRPVSTSERPAVPMENISGLATNKNELIQNEKYLVGMVETVTFDANSGGGVLVLTSSVLDTNTAGTYIENSARQYITKEFTLNLDRDTLFEGKVAADLQPGDVVQVNTNESIYLSDNLAAMRVTFYDPQAVAKQQVLGNEYQIFGSISAKTDTALIVTAEIVDVAVLETVDLTGASVVPRKVVDIAVGIDGNTDVMDGVRERAENLVVGDEVRIDTNENIYGGAALTAKQITVYEPSEQRPF